MFTEQTQTLDLIENWPYGFQRIDDGDELYEYLSIYANELARIDAFIDELYEQRYLETATGHELANLGAAVGVTREAGESDERLRLRIKLAKTVAASDGTADDIRAIFEQAFTENELGTIDLVHQDSDPVVDVQIPSSIIEDNLLTADELEGELERASPCGHGVRVVPDDTFLLGESGDRGIGNGELL